MRFYLPSRGGRANARVGVTSGVRNGHPTPDLCSDPSPSRGG